MSPVDFAVSVLQAHPVAIFWIFVLLGLASVLNLVTNSPPAGTWQYSLYFWLIRVPALAFGRAMQTGLPAGTTGQQAIEKVAQDAGQQILTYVLSQLPPIPPADTTEVPRSTPLEPLPVHTHSISAATHGPLLLEGPIRAERIAVSSTLTPGQAPNGNQAGQQAGFLRVRLGVWLALGTIFCLLILPAGCAMLTAPTSPEGQAQAQEVKGWADYMRNDAQGMAEVEHGGCLALQALPDVGAFCEALPGAVSVVQGAVDAVAAVLSSAASAAQAKATLAQEQAKISPALAKLPPVPEALQQYLDAQAAQIKG